MKNFDLVDTFLAEMYGKQPDLWSHDLEGNARLRCITNYLTRMRLTNAEGKMEFSFKDSLDDPMPVGFQPWFEFGVGSCQNTSDYFWSLGSITGQNH